MTWIQILFVHCSKQGSSGSRFSYIPTFLPHFLSFPFISFSFFSFLSSILLSPHPLRTLNLEITWIKTNTDLSSPPVFYCSLPSLLLYLPFIPFLSFSLWLNLRLVKLRKGILIAFSSRLTLKTAKSVNHPDSDKHNLSSFLSFPFPNCSNHGSPECQYTIYFPFLSFPSWLS